MLVCSLQDPKVGGDRLLKLLSAIVALMEALPLVSLLRDPTLEGDSFSDGPAGARHPGD